jgi:hypothetical protein
MSNLVAMMESGEFGAFVESNVDLLAEATAYTDNFPLVLKDFIASKFEEFVPAFDAEAELTEADCLAIVQETYKNITTCAEFATKQFLVELSTIYGQEIENTAVVTESRKPSINRYF